MKNIIKSRIFYFILGAIIFTTVGAYAATLLASDIQYTNNNQENVQGAIDDLYSKTLYLGKIGLGDYVSMTPTLSSYTIPTTDTGYTEDQTINPSELNVWRIISINSDGTADAVSEYVSSTDIHFCGREGYKNYVGTLNKIAASYTTQNYVVRAKHMGYNGQTNYISDTSKINQTTAPWPTTTSNPTILDEQQGFGEIQHKHDYNLVKNVIGKAYAYKVNTTTSANYYLASRIYKLYTSNSWAFCLVVFSYNNNSDFIGSSDITYNDYSAYTPNCIKNAVRPIITLKAGLTTTGGDGKSEATAWTFE